MLPLMSKAATKKLYTYISVVVTPAPVWVPTRQPLIPSVAENFSLCARMVQG
jgi:hypothetical protein